MLEQLKRKRGTVLRTNRKNMNVSTRISVENRTTVFRISIENMGKFRE